MNVSVRQYSQYGDYERVGAFLVRMYRTTGEHVNWLQPRWEYMHYHPLIRGVDLSSIGLWEAVGEIVAVVHPEHDMGTAYFEVDPDYSLHKVDRVLWRGFDHGDEPPAGGIKDREFMQSAPNFRKELNIVVEAPDGNFACYCGMWYEPTHSIACVEPVATDPDYRRMGLGRAAVLEGVRRCGSMGATLAYVGSTNRFCLSLGFRPAYNSAVWEREWT
jgi:GNAT superfamily N-acetyltransferase